MYIKIKTANMLTSYSLNFLFVVYCNKNSAQLTLLIIDFKGNKI